MRPSFPKTLFEFQRWFPTEESCLKFLIQSRWPDGFVCPRCAHRDYYWIGTRNLFRCKKCNYDASVTAGTVMHRSRMSLKVWFHAAYLVATHTPGMSALQLQRQLGLGSYPTAFAMLHKLRAGMVRGGRDRLNGTVEVDETYIGGKTKGMGHGYKGNKTIVVGATQRGGEARLQVIDDNGRKTLHQFIRENTAPNTEAIYTDEWPAYNGIADSDTRHETVNHSAEEWVRGDVHTNSVEGVWSLLKRSIVGSYHKVSVKHLDSYLDELEWRFNNRENPYLFRDTLLKLINSENLEYKTLTKAKP